MENKKPLNTLVSSGLSASESEVYLFLLTRGEVGAGEIIRRTSLKRGNVYNILKSFVRRGYIEEFDKNGVWHYRLTHPSNLINNLEQQKREVDRQIDLLDSVLPDMVSEFNKAHFQPHITIREGIKGVRYLYNEILRTKKDYLLIRSVFDNKQEELKDLLTTHVIKQIKMGIRVRLIAPLVDSTKEKTALYDKQNLVERRIIPQEKMSLPSQIIIFGQKVAVTSYKETLITTIIDNPDFHETMTKLFEYIWEAGKEDDEKIRSGWK